MMNGKLPSANAELYRHIDEVLYYEWDPIGISEMSGARDEYNMYLPQVFNMLMSGATIEQLAGYLLDVETERMGLDGNRINNIRVARLLMERKDRFRENIG